MAEINTPQAMDVVKECTVACPRGIHIMKAIGGLKLAVVTGKLD